MGWGKSVDVNVFFEIIKKKTFFCPKNKFPKKKKKHVYWLVAYLYASEKYESQLGLLFPIYRKSKKIMVPNDQWVYIETSAIM